MSCLIVFYFDVSLRPFLSLTKKGRNESWFVLFKKKRIKSLHGHEFTNKRQKANLKTYPFKLSVEQEP